MVVESAPRQADDRHLPVTHKGSGETGDETGAQVVGGLFTSGEISDLLARSGDNVLEGDLVNSELGHGVRDLLEQDGTETASARRHQ